MSAAAEYVRAIEAHVCRKNDGHLIRVVGPAFDVVCGWERQGIPLKVALRGIDRYFERYYRNGPKRRPVRVEFCDADVLELFDEWRRAVGVAARAGAREVPDAPYTAPGQAGAAAGTGTGTGTPGPAASEPPGRGPSLPAHLERVLIKLSSARASGRLGAATDGLIDHVSAELDRARAASGGVRGEARRQLIVRLSALDRELIEAVAAGLPASERDAIRRDASEELLPFRERMPAAAFAEAVERSTRRLLRERFGLPIVSFD